MNCALTDTEFLSAGNEMILDPRVPKLEDGIRTKSPKASRPMFKKDAANLTGKNWRHLRIARADDIVEVALHSDGGPLHWTGRAGVELNRLFAALSEDEAAKVLILGGTGDKFCASSATFDFTRIPWSAVWAGQQAMLGKLIELNLIVIAAVNGPVLFHPEIPLMADIVLACPEAEFAELGHFPRGMVPGDGAQLIMQRLIGSSRMRYFYLSQQRIGAAEAERLGFVHESMARDALLPRARELARRIANRPAAMLALSKSALRTRDRRSFHRDLSHSMAIEGLAVAASQIEPGVAT